MLARKVTKEVLMHFDLKEGLLSNEGGDEHILSDVVTREADSSSESSASDSPPQKRIKHVKMCERLTVHSICLQH
jgi:hypothetical protein